MLAYFNDLVSIDSASVRNGDYTSRWIRKRGDGANFGTVTSHLIG